MTLSIMQMHHTRRVWLALSVGQPCTIAELQTLTRLSRSTVRAALWYLRACCYADCRYGVGWVALVAPSYVD